MENENQPATHEEQDHHIPALTAKVEAVQEEINAFNSHILNHKHITSAFAALIMAFIFLGMLIKSIELYFWGLVGVSVVVFIGIMFWRGKQADRLNAEMDVAMKALKKRQRERRKK